MKVIFEEVRMSFIFTSSEPIPGDYLLDNLIRRNFVEITEIPKRIGSEIFGVERLDIAKKGECRVVYDGLLGILSIVGRVPSEVMERFDEVGQMLKDLGYDFTTEIRTYEAYLRSKIFVKGKVRPLEAIANFLGPEKMTKFKDIVGEECAPLCIRFYPKNEMKAIENLRRTIKWFDFNIYPHILNPQDFGIEVVLRNPELSILKDRFMRIEESILRIVEIIVG